MKNKLFILLSAIALTACGGGGGGVMTSDTPPVEASKPAASELAVAADRDAVRVYSVDSGTPALVSTSALPGIPGTYSRAGNVVTVNMPGHDIRDGLWTTLTFAAGTGGTATSGNYKVTVIDNDTFRVTDTSSGAITGGTLMRNPVTQLSGSYTQSNSYMMTITVPNHGLRRSDSINLHFTSGGLADFLAKVDSVLDANTITVEAPTSATASGNVTVGLGMNYTSFDVVMHPSGKWLYVTSGYDGSYDQPYYWGGDVITQYAIDWLTGKLTAVESQRTSTDSGVPVNMAINPAGTRLVSQDDMLDGLRLWTIEASTGRLTQVADSGADTTDEHGIVFSADGKYVYQGTNVFQVSTGPDAITLLSSASGATAARLANNTLFTISTRDSAIHAYALTDPTIPTLITSMTDVTTDRDMAVSKSGSVIVTSGPGGIQTYTFNGTAISASTPSAGSSVMQADGSTAPLSGGKSRMYRSVSLNDAGTLAAASYFTTGNKVDFTPSGIFFAKVAADGGLTHVANFADSQYARVVRILRNPTP